MSTFISYDYPKAPTNKSDWEIGKTYKYKTHPMPCTCHWSEQWDELKTMICDECGYNTTNNKCSCSPQDYLLHKDRARNIEVLSRRTVDTEINNKSFQQAKDCSRAEYRAYLNVDVVGYGKYISSCDHIISPKGYNKKGAYDFDMTLKQHHDFICHYKNAQLLTPHANSVKSSHNDPDELKIVYEEFAKQTPAGDIHDILIAMRKRRDVTEVAHIAEVVAVKKEDVVVEKEKELDPNEKYLMELSEISTSKNSLIINMRSVIFEAEKRKHEKKANKCEQSVKRRDQAIIQCEQLIQKYKVQNTHLIEQKNKSDQLINHLHNLINTH